MPRRPANENPWYWAATLYGEPTDAEIQGKNKHAWNDMFGSSYSLLNGEYDRLFRQRAGAKASIALKELLEQPIDFSWTEFGNIVDFSGFIFRRTVDISGALFAGHAIFKEADFQDSTFEGTIFESYAFFEGASFQHSSFMTTEFRAVAVFIKAKFGRYAVFSFARFSENAVFHEAEFFETAEFFGSRFESRASFVTAKIKGVANFKEARFETRPPEFFDAELNEGTVWPSDDKAWPVPKDRMVAPAFVAAYASLKREMEKLKKHEDELRFFSLELKSREILLGKWRASPSRLYGWLSNYGRSILRPLVGLGVTWLVGVTFLMRLSGRDNWHLVLGSSTANVFGILRFIPAPSLPLDDSPWLVGWEALVAGVQGIAGALLLFLFGLGVRNRFRMK